LPAVRRALEAMAASPGTSPRTSRARLVSTYYDTPDHALAHRGVGLRVRRHGRKFVQTVKTAGSLGENGLARGEWEDRVASEHPDPEAAQTGPFLTPEIAKRLRPLFRTEVSRLTIPLVPEPATRIEAAIDRGQICDGEAKPTEPISEVELELENGASTALYDVALKLLRVAPLRLERRSKAERGYRLASGRGAAKAVHAAPVALNASLTGEAVLRRAGRACLDHLLCNEHAALAGDDEGIHQMRVAVRRLRAILSAFAPLLPKAQRQWASDRLRWLTDALGEARNLDAFSTALVKPARAALPIASEFERLTQAVRRRRRTAHAGVVAAISSPRYTEALLELLRWLDGEDWHRAGDAALQQPIAAVAPALLDHCHARAERCAKHFARQSPTKRHRLRIALKKMRYAAELLAGLCDPAETRQFIQHLKRLQDDLGDANDVAVAQDIIASLAPSDRGSTGIALAGRRILDWHRERIAKNEPNVRRHLNELLVAKPFWQSEQA